MTSIGSSGIVGISGLATLVMLAAPIASAQWQQLGEDIHGEASDDYSGHSVSLSADGTRVAIGAHHNDDNGPDSGHVRVYEYFSATVNDWRRIGDDIDGEAPGDFFGQSVSVSADGSRLAVGGHYNDGNGTESGHVRVYNYSPWPIDGWLQVGADIDGSAAGDHSGVSVALSNNGSCVAVGASMNDSNGSNAGQVKVFHWNSTTWIQKGADIDGEAPNDFSGSAVAVSADCDALAIGAPYNDGNAEDAGHVRVYFWNWFLSQWLSTEDIDGEATGNRSGESVSLSADGLRVAIGSPYDDDNGSNSGHVAVYEWVNSIWDQLGHDIQGEDIGDNSGDSVSLSADGTLVAIGAQFNDDNGIYSGHVRVYRWDGVEWDQFGSDIDGESYNDHSGSSLSLSADGSRLAIGSPGHEGSGPQSGQVRVYSNPMGIFADGFESGNTTNWNTTVP